MEMLATSDEVVCLTVYHHCLTLHTAVKRQKSNSSLCMPTYTDKDKEIDFPAVRYVGLHMQTLVHLPIHFAFAFAGHLKVKNNCSFCFQLRYSYVLHTVLLDLNGTYRTPMGTCKLHSRKIASKPQRIQSHQTAR